jgi:positive regulator of sigma E activity
LHCSGTVVEEKGDLAAVRIETGSCGECRACGFGAVKNRKSMEVYAFNEVGARLADTVTLEASDKKILSASAIIFLIPFAAFIIGILAGYFPLLYLFDAARVPVALVCGFAFFAGSFYIVHLLGRKSEFEFVIRAVNPEETLTPAEKAKKA